jgi:hypothetical protein
MSGGKTVPPQYDSVLVIFSDRTELWWLRWLRRGFRHCFLALNDGRHWITCDPLAHRIELVVQPIEADFDLAAHYRCHGMTVVETKTAATPLRCAPIAVFTCVETVKRVLGLHRRRILTPWQLYRFLTKSADDGGFAGSKNKT